MRHDMTETPHNRWMTDIKGKVNPIVTAYTDSDFPTYLVIGGNRIPFVVKEAKVKGGETFDDPPELELHLDVGTFELADGLEKVEGALGAILNAEEKLQHAKDRLCDLAKEMKDSSRKVDSPEPKPATDSSILDAVDAAYQLSKDYCGLRRRIKTKGA